MGWHGHCCLRFRGPSRNTERREQEDEVLIGRERTGSTRFLMLLALLILAGFHAGFAAAQSTDKTSDGKGKTNVAALANSTASSDDATTYRIGVEDELAISVWKEPELSQV